MKKFKIILFICVLILASCGKDIEEKKEVLDENSSWVVEVETWVVDESKNEEESSNTEVSESRTREEENTLSKTPIKDFVETFLFEQNDNNICFLGCDFFNFKEKDSEIQIANKDGYLNIIFKDTHSFWPSPFWQFTEWHNTMFYLPRKEEKILKKLEKELSEKFNIKWITFSVWNNMTQKYVKVYENHKYIFETVILGLSEDWKHAEISLDYWFDISDFGYIYDMQKWERIGESISYNNKTYTCTTCYDCVNIPDYNNEICKKDNQEQKEKLKIRKIETPEKSFFNQTVKITDDIEIYTKKTGVVESDYINRININLKHIVTKKEVTLMVIDEPKCTLEAFWFYWHPDMQWLIFIYVDKGCYWSYANTKILGKNLLDSKLSILYNNVAMHYYNKKEYTKALEYFQKSIEINNKYWQAYYNKACTYSLLWQKTEAIQTLKQALEIDNKTFKEKAKKDSDFDSIKNEEEFINLVK